MSETLAPFECQSAHDVQSLVPGWIAPSGRCWGTVNHDLSVSFVEQQQGEKATAVVTLTKREFGAFLRWYLGTKWEGH